MKIWQKYLSYIWEIKLKKHQSKLNGDLFVNIEYGKKVLHTIEANYSFQNLHKVLRVAIESMILELPKDGKVLNLGMGGGSSVALLREEFGFEGKIISVEHDPVIVQIAKEDFNVSRFQNHEIVMDDAAQYIHNTDEKKFDLILCDLFKNKEVPEKFQTTSFFQSLLLKLNTGGHLIFNYILIEDRPLFFEQMLNNGFDDFSYFILKPIKNNHVLVLKRD